MSEPLSVEKIDALLRAKFKAYWGKKDKTPDIEVWYSDWADVWWIVASLPPKAPVHGYFKPNDPYKPLDEVLAVVAYRASLMPDPIPPN